jgi:molybdopterin-guanine dinucleotide biosynthesis protein A
MGLDKAMIEIEGVAMARRAASVLAIAGCSRVVAVGGDPLAIGRLGLERVDDAYPGQGPLGGILTVLAVGAPAVVVACDLPQLRSVTVASLIAAIEGHDAAVAVSDRAEPLCAVWAGSAAAALRARFEAGERAVHRAMDGLDIAWVPVALADLRNVNTPGDLQSI